jgi:hypothetical protein
MEQVNTSEISYEEERHIKEAIFANVRNSEERYIMVQLFQRQSPKILAISSPCMTAKARN